jgi:hypothetical protein
MSTPGQGVYTPDLRIKFVEGRTHAVYYLDENGDPLPYNEDFSSYTDGKYKVGDGTRFPLEATLEQIAEMFYRVSDAKFAGGQLGSSYSASVSPPTAQSSKRAWAEWTETEVEEDEETYYDYTSSEFARGYTVPIATIPATPSYLRKEVAPSAHDSAYLDVDDESAEAPAYSAGTLLEAVEFYFPDPAAQVERFYRDIIPNERGIWCDVWTKDFAIHNQYEPYAYYGYLANAFTFRSWDQGYTHLPRRENVFCALSFWSPSPTTEAYLHFNGQIAILKENPTDGFFAPTNRFFVGCIFECWMSTWESGLIWWNSAYQEFSYGTPTFACNYIIRLSSGDLSFPIWAIDDYYGSLSDIIHEATEWFPYGYNSPAEAVWNSATGEKL